MANYICQPMTPKINTRYLGKITVPSGGLAPGNIIIADVMDSNIMGNFEVYTATKPTAQTFGSFFYAVVLNDNFETLSDNRRPAGNPNYFSYTYKEGETAPIMFIGGRNIFNIGIDCVKEDTRNIVAVGNFLVPTDNSYELSAVADINDAIACAFKILEIRSTPVGNGFAVSLVCRPIIDDLVDIGNFFLSYTIPNQEGPTTINNAAGTISLIAPAPLNNLIATFDVSEDATVKIGSTPQVSGVTANNFTNPVTYTVTSEAGVAKTYVATVMEKGATWVDMTWTGLTDFYGTNVWTDGTNVYYSFISTSSVNKVLDTTTNTWADKTWTGLTNFNGAYIWKDNQGHIYYSSSTRQYELDVATSTWTAKTWTGLTNFDGHQVWKDNQGHIYYSSSTRQYELDVATSTWTEKTWTGLTNFSGFGVWKDNQGHIYSSMSTDQYELDEATSTWTEKTWTGLANIDGRYIWTDGTNYYYSNATSQKVLDVAMSTWTSKVWTGLTNFYGNGIWSDGTNIYFSNTTTQKKLV